MALTAFLASTVYTPEPVPAGVVLVEDDRVLAVGPREGLAVPRGARRVEAGAIAPGFVDIHIHGAGGRDLMEASPEAVEVVSRTLVRYGVTSYFPTTVTAPEPGAVRALEVLAQCIEAAGRAPAAWAQPLGIHMEGPFISRKRPGVHPIEDIAEPALEAYHRYARAAGGKLRLLTIAPELAGAPALIAEMLRTGVRPSIGHTDATFEEASRAAAAGARQATHTFNAMRPFGHRDPGVIGAVLTDARLHAELIADGVHVDPAAIRLLYQCKGDRGIVLVSDAISGAGMPDGVYPLAGLQAEVKDGVCRYRGALAGSVLTLDRAVRNMRRFLGLAPEQALRMATRNPAELLGVSDRKGVLQPGADADLVLLDADLQVQSVYARGLQANTHETYG